MNGSRSDPSAGLFGSLRRLLGTVLEIAQTRLELLSAEVEREKLRIFDSMVWAALALLFIGLGLLLLAALVVMLAPASMRLLVLGMLALGCLGLGTWLVQRATQRLRTPAGPLAAARDELARDRAALNLPD